MSRVGKENIILPDGVQLEQQGQRLICHGPKGSLEMNCVAHVEMVKLDNIVSFKPTSESRQARANWGLARSLVANMVKGVAEGWTKALEIRGVGYRAAVSGKLLKLNLGYSRDIDYPIPNGVEIKCDRPTSIVISGMDKQHVGQIAAEIRALRSPEPYKGKGVRYVDEYVLQKEGKKK